MRVGNFNLFTEVNPNDYVGSPTDHGLAIGQGEGTNIFWTDAPTDGQLLIGVTDSDPILNTLVAGSNISIVNGPGSITISASSGGSGLTWFSINSNRALSPNSGYICKSGGILRLSLPAVATVGDLIEVMLDGAAGWLITQPASSRIVLGNQTTSLGGTLSSSAQGDSVLLLCRSTNRWIILCSAGNILVT